MWIRDIVNELDKETLIDFLYQYNDYVQEFYDEHDEGSYPCSISEFYDNEYKEPIKDIIRKEMLRLK